MRIRHRQRVCIKKATKLLSKKELSFFDEAALLRVNKPGDEVRIGCAKLSWSCFTRFIYADRSFPVYVVRNERANGATGITKKICTSSSFNRSRKWHETEMERSFKFRITICMAV